jgi:hypothetical protein
VQPDGLHTEDGRDPVEYLLKLKRDMVPTVSDVAMVALRGVAIILKRTKEGIDVNGKPFAPYSKHGPVRVDGRKYASYEDYKRSGLGRSNVDLMGRNARMLQAVKVQIGGLELEQGAFPPSGSEPAKEFRIGIYDQKQAIIGAAHNSGARTGRGGKVNLPQREWFGLSEAEQAELNEMLLELTLDRLSSEA